jgi:DNA polymerase I-like protein with 3'-5' exonuclease and polymerase domains
VEAVCRLALEIMPAAMSLDVPLKVEVKSGANWGDMEPLAVSTVPVA